MSLDGTKIKAKTSINKLTDENQIKIMKKHFEISIELNQQEDEELGDESYPLENSQEKKKVLFMGKPFQKDNFCYDAEIETYICPLGEIYYKKIRTPNSTKNFVSNPH